MSNILSTSASALSGGVDQVNGQGEDVKFTFAGTWVTGDSYTVDLTDSLSGIVTEIGAGNVSGISPNFCFTFNDKEYVLSGSMFLFSAIGDPTTWNDPNAAGNGFVTSSNFDSTQEPLAAIAPYQGGLAFVTRRNVQIWGVDPDPALYVKKQVLPNIGTIAPASVQAVGDMDIYMLADNGVRSVRVRDASNNAIIADVGTPIDKIIQDVLVTLTDAQKAASCGCVEPSSNRYWLFIPDTADEDNGVGKIYVFSYFPSSQIAAWSTYSPTYNLAGVQTSFTPEKFFVFKGQVWCRDTNGNFYQFGGTNDQTYDNCGVSVTTPFVDTGEPATNKFFDSFDFAFEGTWAVNICTDYATEKFSNVYNNNASSFLLQSIGYGRYATHFAAQMIESSTGYARFSQLIAHLKKGDEK